MWKLVSFIAAAVIAVTVIGSFGSRGGPVLAQNEASGPTVSVGQGPAVSPRLRDLVPEPPRHGPLIAIPLGKLAHGAVGPILPDPALQREAIPSLFTPAAAKYPGVSNLDNLVPPDPNAAVGNGQVVELVNEHYQVFSTSGTSLAGPFPLTQIWSQLGGNCTTPDSSYDDDPIVLYDQVAGRWLMTAIAGDTSTSSGTECVAISTTSDATGSFYLYSFSFSAFNDYPKWGVWPDAYYASYNMFGSSGTFVGAQVCAYNRAAMLSGGTATSVCFQRSTSDFSLLPAGLEGATAPPSGEPDFYLELASTSSGLNLYRFHVDFSTPSNSSFTGPIAIQTASFSEPCPTTACIPQEGTTQLLDSLADRLMFPLAYRNFGTYESLVVTHTITAGSSSGIRWYEIHSPNGTPSVYQQGTYAPNSNWRWMSSAAMDSQGDIAIGYSVSSSSMYPSIAYALHTPSDPLGTLESENIVLYGSGSQTGFEAAARWGDYTSMAINPSDDATFFYTNEYYTTSGSDWQTNINSFSVPRCSPNGGNCSSDANCCNGVCNGVGFCAASCLPGGSMCGQDSDCCSGYYCDQNLGVPRCVQQ